MQNDNCLIKQHLANMTLESDILKTKMVWWEKKLVSLIEEKTCHRKNKISSKSLQNTGMKERCSERLHDFSLFLLQKLKR